VIVLARADEQAVGRELQCAVWCSRPHPRHVEIPSRGSGSARTFLSGALGLASLWAWLGLGAAPLARGVVRRRSASYAAGLLREAHGS
jgi:hypothetical protein